MSHIRFRLSPAVALLLALSLVGISLPASAQQPKATAFDRYREDIEKSVGAALEYLATNQNPDGTYDDA
ncbi:MAG: hypothetical protein KDL87_06710, partial [Verrucomicrobiae bacterium]|nr:hypothetical protein [Verrucomicrobiae bacterium]